MSSKLPSFHVHVGAGKLGIGAVLPSLRDDRALVVVQRRGTGDWSKVAAAASDKMELYEVHAEARCSGEAGQGAAEIYKAWFVCICEMKSAEEVLKAGRNALLLVNDLRDAVDLMLDAESISVSLGKGQADMARALVGKDAARVPPILAFENQLARELGAAPYAVDHAITDRICSKRTISEEEPTIVSVLSEPQLSIVAPRGGAAEAALKPGLLGAEVRLVDPRFIPFYQAKKRALVNSLHFALALLSVEALATLRIRPEEQYLPVVMSWWQNNFPSLRHGLEAYIKLRALELIKNCWECADVCAIADFTGVDRSDPMFLQSAFDSLLREARDAERRFRSEPEQLRRLLDPKKRKDTASKYREHIRAPLRAAAALPAWLERRERGLYDGPNFGDVDALSELFSGAYVTATQD